MNNCPSLGPGHPASCLVSGGHDGRRRFNRAFRLTATATCTINTNTVREVPAWSSHRPVQPVADLPAIDAAKSARRSARGRLQPEERFPSVRELSRSLVVNPNTVRPGLHRVGAGGNSNTRPGLGVFVARVGNDLSRKVRRERLRQASTAFSPRPSTWDSRPTRSSRRFRSRSSNINGDRGQYMNPKSCGAGVPPDSSETAGGTPAPQTTGRR